NLELKRVAETIIYATQFKRPIVVALKGQEFGIVCEYIKNHLKSQNDGIISAINTLNKKLEVKELA
ncbi:hypothetical protein ACWIYZ_07465, partial [Ursidibacter arcticus]